MALPVLTPRCRRIETRPAAANIPVIAFGPMLMQSHLAVYVVWVLAATWKIMAGHLGWNLPFVGSPDAHDFHHSFRHARLDECPQNP